MWLYRHQGLSVASDLKIPGLDPCRSTEPPDVVVTRKRGTAALERPGVFTTGAHCRLELPDAGRFEITGGRHIALTTRAAASPEVIRLRLLGVAWAALLRQRGSFALHASATADGQGAVALVGPSGAGKSTLLAHRLNAGHAFVCDDMTRLDVPAAGQPRIWRSMSALRLSADAAASARRLFSASPGTKGLDGKRAIRWTGDRSDEALPLRAICLLRWGPSALVRLTGGEAVRRLTGKATYAPALIAEGAPTAHTFEQCARIVRAIDIWELSRERDLRTLDNALPI
jgi:hypothetical protein